MKFTSPANKCLALVSVTAALLIAGCNSTSEVVFEKGDPGQTTTTGNYSLNTMPHIVHVEMRERIATLRNGGDLPEGFVVAEDVEGNKTAVLKTLPMRTSSSLRTADVLEGKPQINNAVRLATPSEAKDLEKIYRDAE